MVTYFGLSIGIMEDGQLPISTSWGLLGWSSLETFALVDYLAYIMHGIIIQVGLIAVL